jgi:hypothetical protein
VRAQFAAQTCTASGAVLGSAGPVSIARDNAAFPFPATWYHGALANKLAGSDLDVANPDINATFNLSIDTGCLTGTLGWYYGLDNLAPANRIDLAVVLLHEFGHGLGFSTLVNTSTGAPNGGFTDAYAHFTFDLTLGRTWSDPLTTNAERQASAINARKLVWNGAGVTAAVPTSLSFGYPKLTINSPAGLAGTYEFGASTFGAALTGPGTTGNVVLGVDGTAPVNDGCEPLTNAGAMAGNVCLVDRGTCTFVIKVKNCQNAGAIAAIVADNAAGEPPAPLGGADPTITIPSGRISITLGTSIKAQLPAPGVNVNVFSDLTQRAGADSTGRAMLNATNPIQPGSSVSHWDPIASPNLLMEPAINVDLTYKPDLAEQLFEDIGWGAVAPVELQRFTIE